MFRASECAQNLFRPCVPQAFRSLWPGQAAPVDKDFLTAIRPPLSSYRFSISTLSNRSSASSNAMSPLSSVAVFAADMAAALFNAV